MTACYGATTPTLAPTVKTYTGSNSCCSGNTGGGTPPIAGGRHRATFTFTDRLSIEDTESQALVRANLTAVWGAWVAGSDVSCLAFRSVRGAGQFSFAYQDAEWRHVATGLNPAAEYTLKVSYFRRAIGSVDWALFAEDEVTGTPDGSGNLTFSGTVPAASGLETYAGAAQLCTELEADLPGGGE
jgi:hypothetical protein